MATPKAVETSPEPIKEPIKEVEESSNAESKTSKAYPEVEKDKAATYEEAPRGRTSDDVEVITEPTKKQRRWRKIKPFFLLGLLLLFTG